ncbi:MAG: BMP family ABC transporter substrate-binding protein [Acidimicrobiia bacterium]|nr:BMP family ABC transporter substrate-binding protein [Acidimicrobiia bacterium]MXX46286.1 BMP family ABC transporter substrate-binding protein [Acidimicrobiia bacterium]MXY74618.1 BMP family ABC transporter substrate-binding protein [Acidimicrobiia bacterium]MYA38127.1 BMP family ABC transporter substrate-binding protein [Acidimicrobiia bacterium]MYB78160.1 BMP family ABC transporter substrate-binding protein [Acidimicrobiia bacterium]
MRKRIFGLSVLAALSLLVAGCGGGDDTSVYLVFDIGGRGDQSFNDSAAAGLDRATEELGIAASELEPTAGGENRDELLNLAAEDGAQLVFGVGFLFTDAIAAAAETHPDTNFGLIDGFVPELTADSNLVSLGFAEHEGSFLVGAAAALKTQTGKVGFIGGVEIDLIKRFEAGFVAGVRHIDPGIEIDVKYISQPPDFAGFTDPAKGKEIGAAMYQAGADVVYHAAGSSGGGLFQSAKEQSEGTGSHVWAIGVDSDQYLTAGDDFQPYILTSMLKRVDVAVFETISTLVDDSFDGGYRTFDLSVDGVGYATSGGHVADIADQLDDLKAQVISGAITVPQAP